MRAYSGREGRNGSGRDSPWYQTHGADTGMLVRIHTHVLPCLYSVMLYGIGLSFSVACALP